MDSLLLLILQIGTGVFWSITYILIIRQGFKDKMLGIPMIALCSNISWEFIFSFLYSHQGLQSIIDVIWFILDIIIVFQYMKYGRIEFEKILPSNFFYPVFLLTMALSFSIILATIPEFNDFNGKYAAFGSNFLMSVLFIALFFTRGNTKGQSLFIAIFKMLGSLFAALGFYIYFRTGLIALLSLGNLLFDLIYIALIYKHSTYISTEL